MEVHDFDEEAFTTSTYGTENPTPIMLLQGHTFC